MTETAAANPLFYEHRDEGDHPEGGACLSVFIDESPVERLERYSDEYYTALCALYVASESKPSGWQYASPAVFLAHHACELALKVRWLRADSHLSTDDKAFHIHDLRDILKRIAKVGGWTGSDAGDAERVKWLITQLRAVTRDGISIRYATIDERWCCLNLGALVELVEEVRSIAMREATTT